MRRNLQKVDITNILRILFLLNFFFSGTTRKNEWVSHWDYKGENGPSNWKHVYPFCAYKRQSPVNIKMDKVINDTELGRIMFGAYTEPIRKAILKNTGHSAQLNFYNAKQWIGAANMTDKYKLMQLHFHWGLENERGSEHTIDEKRFPLEMHLVHYNERYKPTEAAKKPDGLAVLAVLFEISREDNERFSSFLEALQEIKEESSELFLLHRFNLSNFIPEETFPYFRYKGSLTTPPCYESVTWTILAKKQTLSSSQLKMFRNLKKTTKRGSSKMGDNFRPVQKLYGRVIRLASEEGIKEIAASTGKISSLSNLFASLSVPMMNALFGKLNFFM